VIADSKLSHKYVGIIFTKNFGSLRDDFFPESFGNQFRLISYFQFSVNIF